MRLSKPALLNANSASISPLLLIDQRTNTAIKNLDGGIIEFTLLSSFLSLDKILKGSFEHDRIGLPSKIGVKSFVQKYSL